MEGINYEKLVSKKIESISTYIDKSNSMVELMNKLNLVRLSAINMKVSTKDYTWNRFITIISRVSIKDYHTIEPVLKKLGDLGLKYDEDKFKSLLTGMRNLMSKVGYIKSNLFKIHTDSRTPLTLKLAKLSDYMNDRELLGLSYIKEAKSIIDAHLPNGAIANVSCMISLSQVFPGLFLSYLHITDTNPIYMAVIKGKPSPKGKEEEYKVIKCYLVSCKIRKILTDNLTEDEFNVYFNRWTENSMLDGVRILNL